jgi:type III restriction enzyme
VVANESYEKYVENLQNEIIEDYGLEGAPPKPANARNRKTVKLRKEFTLKPEFKELWDCIKHKTRYSVEIDTKQVIKDVSKELKDVTIEPPRITVTKAQVDIDKEDHLTARQMSSTRTAATLPSKSHLPDILRVMDYLLQNTSPPVRLSRRTLFEIFNKYPRPKDAMANPHEFSVHAINIIKDVLAEHLVSGIQYERLNEWYEMSLFEAELEEWEDYLVPAKNSIYDHIAYDSDIEHDFVKDLEKRDDVKLYVKLPGWFVVKTPVGEYNPDWAVVMEDRDEHGEPTGKPMLYLVRETKGTTNLNELRPDERRKILCGKKHFTDTLGVDYKVVKTVAEIR